MWTTTSAKKASSAVAAALSQNTPPFQSTIDDANTAKIRSTARRPPPARAIAISATFSSRATRGRARCRVIGGPSAIGRPGVASASRASVGRHRESRLQLAHAQQHLGAEQLDRAHAAAESGLHLVVSIRHGRSVSSHPAGKALGAGLGLARGNRHHAEAKLVDHRGLPAQSPLLERRQPVGRRQRWGGGPAPRERTRRRAPRPARPAGWPGPCASASSPDTPRPVRIRSIAWLCPISRGRRTVPRSMSGTPKRRQ